MQRMTRGFLARKELHRCEYAALVIQRAWWGLVEHLEQQESAVLIQSQWRQFEARKKYDKRLCERAAACSIQRMWRGYYRQLWFAITVQSAVMIQKVGRGFISRRELPLRRYRVAATLMQKTWRGFSVQVQYHLDLLDVVTVQSVARRKMAMGRRKLRLHAIGVLQGAFRSTRARRALWAKYKEREIARKRRAAAVTCQVSVRSWSILIMFGVENLSSQRPLLLLIFFFFSALFEGGRQDKSSCHDALRFSQPPEFKLAGAVVYKAQPIVTYKLLLVSSKLGTEVQRCVGRLRLYQPLLI
jgi:hypothetical protein